MSSIRRMLSMLPLLLLASAIRAQAPVERGPDSWRPLADFESVEAFEQQLTSSTQDCVDGSGGGSLAATCFHLHELWDRELNIQYQRLRDALDAAGREKLVRSQRDWITYRDSAFAFERHMTDFSYSAPGTMWLGIAAQEGVAIMARIVRERTLMLLEWHEQLARGPVDEETLLNE